MHTALFHSVGNCEGLGCFSTVLDSGLHSIVELSDDGDELSWASILCHYSPETHSASSVEGLGQVDIGGAQVG